MPESSSPIGSAENRVYCIVEPILRIASLSVAIVTSSKPFRPRYGHVHTYEMMTLPLRSGYRLILILSATP